MTDAIVVQGLRKRFADVEAVSDVSFSVPRGELFGFLGPNGAGKTTTINVLTGLARPDAGSVRIGGIDCTSRPRAAQHLLGVVPDESNLYPELTGLENLCFCAALYGIGKSERQRRARELLDGFGLTQAAGRRFGGYSRGMKRRLVVAAGIIHRPEILFLDEPTTGLDVASARQLRQLVADLKLRCRAVGPGLIRVEADQPVRLGPLVRFLEDHGAEVSEARRSATVPRGRLRAGHGNRGRRHAQGEGEGGRRGVKLAIAS